MALPRRHLIPALAGLFLLAFCTALRAQPSAPEPAPAQFRVVTMTQVETLLFDVGKTTETINAGVGSFSALYPAPRDGAVVFYQKVPAADPALPPIKKPLAQVRLPAAKPSAPPGPFLIILDRGAPGAAVAFDARVIDASLEAHPAGTYRVFNFSRRRLAVNLADTKLLLERGANQNAPYPSSRKAWLQVAVEKPAAGWILVSSSAHPVAPDSRTTVFLVDVAASERDPDPEAIVVRRIRETIATDATGARQIR